VVGLPSPDIPSLLKDHGYNEFSVSAPEPFVIKFAKTIYESPLILLLCGSAVVSAVMGNVDDAISIAVAVTIVLTGDFPVVLYVKGRVIDSKVYLVGFIQEHRSEKSLDALNKLVPHHTHVLRDGYSHHVLANELVPGDIVLLSTGDRVPADIRLLEALDLEIDESSLTGETEGRQKVIEKCTLQGGEAVPLAERTCMGFMGTLVRNGQFLMSWVLRRSVDENFIKRERRGHRHRDWSRD
jgi:Ca2+-transporting ATPase